MADGLLPGSLKLDFNQVKAERLRCGIFVDDLEHQVVHTINARNVAEVDVVDLRGLGGVKVYRVADRGFVTIELYDSLLRPLHNVDEHLVLAVGREVKSK